MKAVPRQQRRSRQWRQLPTSRERRPIARQQQLWEKRSVRNRSVEQLRQSDLLTRHGWIDTGEGFPETNTLRVGRWALPLAPIILQIARYCTTALRTTEAPQLHSLSSKNHKPGRGKSLLRFPRTDGARIPCGVHQNAVRRGRGHQCPCARHSCGGRGRFGAAGAPRWWSHARPSQLRRVACVRTYRGIAAELGLPTPRSAEMWWLLLT